MRFDPEQEELRRTVRTLLERAAGGDVWRLLAEQVGAHPLAIPEEYGGAGFSVLETHVVLEELGAALAAPGFLSTTLAAQAILTGDGAEAKAALLPGIADGQTRAAVAWSESGSWDPQGIQSFAEQVSDGWLLTGAKDHVLDGDGADLFVVLARIAEYGDPAKTTGNISAQTAGGIPERAAQDVGSAQIATGGGSGRSRLGLFAVAAADAEVVPTETVDPTRPQASVGFRRSSATALSADVERVMDLACAAISAEQVGAAQRAFDLTLAYARQRVQFGRPIGSFQAVKHRLADLFALLESARSASYAAAFAAASGHELTVAASRAKAYCSEAFSTIAGEAVQLHGGIGITWEHPIHLYFKRAHATSQLFGTPAWHRLRYARAVGLAA
jgi:alkylation response protein AidB-like acyl-CoA dehydrogenase